MNRLFSFKLFFSHFSKIIPMLQMLINQLVEISMKPKYFFLLCLSFYILNSTFSIATVRYVSKTGTSTPPYTSWATTADSIQKCINYSVDGDTIIVANGTYHESLIVNKYLWLIGSSMDSTIIDGTGLANFTVDFQSNGHFQLFTIKG